MTEIECLEKMIKVWKFLESCSGVDAKQKAYAHYRLSKDRNFCPCCEYVSQYLSKNFQTYAEYRDFETPDCDLCPLKDLWNDKWGNNIYCEVGGSAYQRWKSKDQKTSSAAAKEISDYSEQLLNKLRRLQNAPIL